MNNLLTHVDSNDANRCSEDRMPNFLEGLRGMFGFDLVASAPGVDDQGLVCSDDDCADGLTALGFRQRSVAVPVSTAGV